MLRAALLAIALAAQDPAAGAASPDSMTRTDAYLDPAARELVQRAKERRRLADFSIRAYQAIAEERITLGLRVRRWDRLFYRREVATRIAWEREGPVRMEVLGAREAVPLFLPRPRVPEALAGDLPHLAFDPADQRLLIGWTDTSFVRHPLAPDGEAHYRFASGGTTTIQLPDGRTVRLRELRILPRRNDVHLIRGSFWLDAGSHAVVQAVFRLAGDYDLERDTDDPDAGDEIPRVLKPIRARVEHVAIEYGLQDLEWWLPRVVTFEGWAQVGRLATLPFRYERRYSRYEVTATPTSPRPLAADSAGPGTPGDRCRITILRTIGADGEVRVQARGDGPPDSAHVMTDSAMAAEAPGEPGDRPPGPRDGQPPETKAGCQRYIVDLPADTAKLLASEYLPESPYAAGPALLSEAELEALAARLREIAPAPWQFDRRRVRWGIGGPALIRYNRVEGLSLGAQAEADFGRLAVSVTGRFGLADRVPNAEFSLARPAGRAHHELTAYRRLVPMDPLSQPFSLNASLSSLLLGRDEAQYYRATGVELRGRPAAHRRLSYEWRLYAERESPARKETDFTLRRLFDEDFRFPENVPAARARQYGAALALRTAEGQDPLGFRVGSELELDGATGTYTYGRAALTLGVSLPVPGRYVGAIEAAGGTTFGDVPTQHLWRLGGPGTLRGYPGSILTGTSFWRARAEIGNELPAARLVLFADAGWAGDLESVGIDEALASAGVGVSFMGGVLRLDLARALRSPTGWRATMYLDGRL